MDGWMDGQIDRLGKEAERERKHCFPQFQLDFVRTVPYSKVDFRILCGTIYYSYV